MDRVCRYIDDYHLLVDKNLFHICEFAEKIKENNYKVIPDCRKSPVLTGLFVIYVV